MMHHRTLRQARLRPGSMAHTLSGARKCTYRMCSRGHSSVGLYLGVQVGEGVHVGEGLGLFQGGEGVHEGLFQEVPEGGEPHDDDGGPHSPDILFHAEVSM